MPENTEFKPSKIITTEVEMMGKKKVISYTLTLELVKTTIKKAKEYRKIQKALLTAKAKMYDSFSPRNKEVVTALDSGNTVPYDNITEEERTIYESEKEAVEAYIRKVQFDMTINLLKNFYVSTKGEDIYKELISTKNYDENWDSIDLEFLAAVEETVAHWFRQATLIG